MGLPRRAFMEALDGDPHISRAIMAVLAARVRRLERAISA
jgi:CRP-like cAMP-binding protein